MCLICREAAELGEDFCRKHLDAYFDCDGCHSKTEHAVKCLKAKRPKCDKCGFKFLSLLGAQVCGPCLAGKEKVIAKT